MVALGGRHTSGLGHGELHLLRRVDFNHLLQLLFQLQVVLIRLH